LKHELAQLAAKVDWGFIDSEIAPLYSDKGRPGIPTRFAEIVEVRYCKNARIRPTKANIWC
jgi:hypothetical protein